MTPSERERRIKAVKALQAMQARWFGMVEQSKQHVERARVRAERAEAAARGSRDLLVRIAASLKDGTLDIPDVCHAVEAEIAELLAVHPSFSGEEGAEG